MQPAPPVAEPPTFVERSPAGDDLERVLRKNSKLAPLVDQAAELRMQVLVSVVSPDGRGWQKREGFRVDAEYFYPASAIKLCSAVAALETLTELRESGAADLDVEAGFLSDAVTKRRGTVTSVANLVSGALVMSDNDASNDLFDLAGFDGVHERMWRLGLSTFRMRHRLGAGFGDIRVSPRVELLTGTRPVALPAREGKLDVEKNDQEGVLVGDSYLSGGVLVEEPMSFAEKNRISLADLQELLIAVMKPELRSTPGPRLGPAERELLVTSLSTLPSSRGLKASADAEHKPFLAGLSRVIPRGKLTLASKSGRAYGFLVENAYVLDERTGRSFFLAATLYANSNRRLNDDTYDYREVAYPALADLAEVVARYALEE
ncbi:MAG TPA: serine hydrolase [Labilithrix sp.]|nr:serine hydrolase [Labilithrix sp.]